MLDHLFLGLPLLLIATVADLFLEQLVEIQIRLSCVLLFVKPPQYAKALIRLLHGVKFQVMTALEILTDEYG